MSYAVAPVNDNSGPRDGPRTNTDVFHGLRAKPGDEAELDAYRRQKLAAAKAKAKSGASGAKSKPKKTLAPKPQSGNSAQSLCESSSMSPSLPAINPSNMASKALGTSQVETDGLPDHVRFCPKGRAAGHELVCCPVGGECGICDECDSLQQRGALIFRCVPCDYEICATCAMRASTSKSAGKAIMDVLSRTARDGARNTANFICGPTGEIVDAKASDNQRPTAPSPSITAPVQDAPLPAGVARGEDSAAEATKVEECVAEVKNALAVAGKDALLEMIAEQERLAVAMMEQEHVSAGVSSAVAPERSMALPPAAAADFVEDLASGHSQAEFRDQIRECACRCGSDRAAFAAQWRSAAMEVQRPILERWGFEPGGQGLYDMWAVLREHAAIGAAAPDPGARERAARCLATLRGDSDAVAAHTP